ncbi:MAG: YkvA family protein [Acidobacteriota bacterium]
MSNNKEPKTKLKRREKSALKGRMRNFLMFLPNMMMLMGRLLKDARVPIAEKALFAAAIVYVISPLDFIPDVFPFIGQVDDLYVVALVLLRLVNRTDESVVREHWTGGGDIVSLADSIASIAPKFLPKRISRVLTSRVELAPAGKLIRGITNRDEVLVREIRADEIPDIDTRSRMAN